MDYSNPTNLGPKVLKALEPVMDRRRYLIETKIEPEFTDDLLGVIKHVIEEGTSLTVTVTEDPDHDVYNDLPAPFDQAYANLYEKMDDFVIAALEGGVNPLDLRKCMESDVDAIFFNRTGDHFPRPNPQNHPDPQSPKDEGDMRVPALLQVDVCDNCGLQVSWMIDSEMNASWCSVTGSGTDADFLCKPSNGAPLTMHSVIGWAGA